MREEFQQREQNPGEPLSNQSFSPSLVANPVKEALELLRKGLSPELYYHSIEHTEHVMQTVDTLARADGLNIKERELLQIAAAFHDTGYLIQNDSNEPYGAAFAKAAMIREGYPKEDIDLVTEMIMATEIIVGHDGVPQQREAKGIACYLQDADLSNFGSEDFFEQSKLVLREQIGKPLAETTLPEFQKFLSGATRMLEVHSWKTPAGKAIFEDQRLENADFLKRVLKRLGE